MIRAIQKFKIPWLSMKRNFYLAFLAIFLLQMVLKMPSIYLEVVTLICLPLAFRDCSKITGILGMIFLGIGSVLLGLMGANISLWMNGTQEMVDIICLLMVIQNLAIPLEAKKYKKSFRTVVQSVTSTKILYMATFIAAAILGGIVSFAIVPLLFFLVRDAYHSVFEHADRSSSIAIKRGFALALTWSPLSVIMAVTMEHTQVAYIKILPYSLLFIATGILLSLVILLTVRTKERKIKTVVNAGIKNTVKFKDLLYHFIYSAVLMIFVLCLVNGTNLGPTRVIILASLSLPFIWCLFFKEGALLKEKMLDIINKDILYTMDDIFIIFISVGVLAFSVKRLGLGSIITPLLITFKQILGIHFLYLLFPLVVILFSTLGIHPLAIIVLILQSVNASLLGVDPEIYAVMMIVGGAIANILSPFAVTTFFLVGSVQKSPLEVGIRWNIGYVTLLLMLFFLQLFLLVV